MAEHGHNRFEARVAKAVSDGFLSKALRRAQDTFGPKRAAVIESLPDWQGWRDHTAAVRKHTIAHLDHYLRQFIENVEARGARVYLAADAREAREYIVGLACEKGVRSIVKSKSMVTEEIHLNQALEQQGMEVVETDLGEYIIQLAKEPPSHIIAPAIHKTKEQVAEIFSALAGRKLSSQPEELTAFAREVLREKFLRADMGISGCNFGVASTGSLVLVSNEGNARLSTTLPRVHVAVMGMERLVPDLESLDPILTVLPRSATGQKATTYLTVLSGPRREGDKDGPEELHVVIVDNGRSGILGTAYQSVLQCIRCGACLNACPVYRQIGGHSYGSVYPGPIGAVLSPLLAGMEKHRALPFASSLCGACQEVCPARVPLTDLLVELRRDMVCRGMSTRRERLAFLGFGLLAKSPRLFGWALKGAYRALAPWAKNGRIERGPGPLSGWTQSRNFPQPPRESFRSWWAARKSGPEQGE
ncbi:MAG: LutB/LldF family L-lactate oxidation iron-sulfur protein [Deltaproteobacteria bacterium]|nr:LutB/LldF family L-lactate oxidation iron-sulfur protein [Deltaproteobacteria bacterium]